MGCLRMKKNLALTSGMEYQLKKVMGFRLGSLIALAVMKLSLSFTHEGLGDC